MKRLLVFLMTFFCWSVEAITLTLKDGTSIEVSNEFVAESVMLKDLIEITDQEDDSPVLIPNKYVTQDMIEKMKTVIAKSDSEIDEIVSAWAQEDLARTILGADFLQYKNIKILLDSLAKKVFLEGVKPEVSGLFETLKIVNGHEVIEGLLNPTIRTKIVDAMSSSRIGKIELKGNIGNVRLAVFSPDSSRILTISEDNTVKIWDTLTGKCTRTLEGDKDVFVSAEFSPDGLHVATVLNNKIVKILDVESGKFIDISEYSHTRIPVSVKFSSDSSRIITTALNKEAKIWDVRSGECRGVIGDSDRIFDSAKFSPDGSFIVTTSNTGTVEIWDAQNLHRINTLSGHTNWVFSVEFSPDGSRIVTASADQTARIWSARSGECLYTLQGHASQINSAEFSPNGLSILTAAKSRTAKMWDTKTGTCIYNLQGHTSNINSAEFSPDGLSIITFSDDNTVIIWDAKSGKPIRMLKPNNLVIHSVRFSPDNSFIIIGSRDNAVGVYRVLNKIIATCGWDLYEVPLAQLREWAHSGIVPQAPRAP